MVKRRERERDLRYFYRIYRLSLSLLPFRLHRKSGNWSTRTAYFRISGMQLNFALQSRSLPGLDAREVVNDLRLPRRPIETQAFHIRSAARSSKRRRMRERSGRSTRRARQPRIHLPLDLELQGSGGERLRSTTGPSHDRGHGAHGAANAASDRSGGSRRLDDGETFTSRV